jgi:EAL domain-containing protein (putative c-di-GMP-specific phosphodiesterase class I)
MNNKHYNILGVLDQSVSPLELEMALQTALQSAFTEHEFYLDYQAQCNINGTLLGAEALVRWRHPQQGMLLPYEFLDSLERFGLMHALNLWIADNVCQLLQRVHREISPDLILSFNLPLAQLYTTEFTEQIGNVLQRYSIPANRLVIELLGDNDLFSDPLIMTELHKLRALGCGLSVDHFGDNYQLLSLIADLPLTQIKIPGELIHAMQNPDACLLVEHLILIANALNMNVIAEHVETEEQFKALAALGCPALQGYYLFSPMNEKNFFIVCKQLTEIRRSYNNVERGELSPVDYKR